MLIMKTITKKHQIMHNPPHPGETIKVLCLEPLNLSVTEAAKALGVSRKMLSQVINGRARISPNLAMRLAKAFNTTPESWLNQQIQYDLWQEAQHQTFKEVRVLY
jgi:antitoxin HigA-1